MFDIKKSEKAFTKYVGDYDLSKDSSKHKYYHSFRVEKVAREIAEGLNLSKEKVELATLIGLLHDIGRFEQLNKYNTFNDLKSFDHGDYGAEVLSNNIRDFIDSNKYDKTIIESVKNHNKFKITDGLDEEQAFFSKLVRDADKIDILYESVSMFWNGKEDLINNSVLSDYSYECVKNNRLLDSKKETNPKDIDDVIKTLAFTFDLNFKPSFEILKSNNYINKVLDRYDFTNLETKQKMEDVRYTINSFIDTKLEQFNS